MLTAVVVYAAFALLLHQILFVHLFQFGYFTFIKKELDHRSRLISAKTIGLLTGWGDLVLGIIIYVPAWTLLYRADPGIVAYFAVALLPLLTVRLLHHMSAIALRIPLPPWIPLGTAVVFTPLKPSL